MKWMSSCELLCLTVKLQSISKDLCYCSELRREGVKTVSQTENVHVISVLFRYAPHYGIIMRTSLVT